jgi:uncharacterized protein
VNTGLGATLQTIEIGHPTHAAVVDPDTAFWALLPRKRLGHLLTDDSALVKAYRRRAKAFRGEIETLRFGISPSAVYFNPTERCNLNCVYCYIPEEMRRSGRHMSEEEIVAALERFKRFFDRTLPRDRKPQIIFHGAEPLLNRASLFRAIEGFAPHFRFGIQTNGTLLDKDAVAFLTARDVSIGLSLDSDLPKLSARTRRTWNGVGVHERVMEAMHRLRDYPYWSVICTITAGNMSRLTRLVELFHEHRAPSCLMNIVRLTLAGARTVAPDEVRAARHLIAALERSRELARETGRKLPVANFANILLAIIAPSARRLMCDISPCGGGRAFFALAPGGDLFPCSEFIGLDRFRGGNIFHDEIETILESEPFRLVTGRRIEEIEPCRRCAIRHFCGAPCPAEAHEMNGGMARRGGFCTFYEELTRYAFRILADEDEDLFLWDDWKKGTKAVFDPILG